MTRPDPPSSEAPESEPSARAEATSPPLSSEEAGELAAVEDEEGWQRQSPLLILLASWDAAREGIGQIVFGAAAVQSDAPLALQVIFLVLIGAKFLPVLWVWFLTRHRLTDDSIEVRSGLLTRKHTVIPLERIQAADQTSGVLQRVFRLVRLRISSGAAGTQVDLKALRPSQAEGLLAAIDLARAAAAATKSDAPAHEEGGSQHESSESSESSEASPPLRAPGLGVRPVLALALTSGRALAIVATGWVILERVFDATGGDKDATASFLARASESIQAAGPALWLGVIALGIVVFLVASTIEILIRWGGFRLEVTPQELRIGQGLIERKVVTLRRDKLQAVRVVEPLFLSAFGYVAIDVDVIGHSDQKGSAARIHPALHREDLEAFWRDFLPQFQAAGELVTPPPRAQIRFWLKPLLSLSVALALTGVAAGAWGQPWLLLGALLFLPGVWLGGRRFRETGILLMPEHALVRSWSGWTRTSAYVPRRRVQAAWTSSSWFQRRRNLSTAGLRVASGATGQHYAALDLDPDQAHQIVSWLAARPETT
ncbi:MAG: PH domain-containing protein [Planctomycetes bacterium]|nr:PH domain-containing protein [Planctomycetota bacterium]